MFIYKGPKMKLGSVCRADRAQSNGPILLIDSENHNAELATLSQILEESQLQTNVFKTSSSNLCFELGMQHDPNTATVETHTVSLSCSLSLSLSLSSSPGKFIGCSPGDTGGKPSGGAPPAPPGPAPFGRPSVFPVENAKTQTQRVAN